MLFEVTMFGGYQKTNLIKVTKVTQHPLYLSKNKIIIRSSANEQNHVKTNTHKQIQRYSMSITNKDNVNLFKRSSKFLRNGVEVSVVKP